MTSGWLESLFQKADVKTIWVIYNLSFGLTVLAIVYINFSNPWISIGNQNQELAIKDGSRESILAWGTFSEDFTAKKVSKFHQRFWGPYGFYSILSSNKIWMMKDVWKKASKLANYEL